MHILIRSTMATPKRNFIFSLYPACRCTAKRCLRMASGGEYRSMRASLTRSVRCWRAGMPRLCSSASRKQASGYVVPLTQLIDRIHESMQRLAIPETPGECDYAKDGQGTGATWDVRCGFHSIPSMHHLHLHVRRATDSGDLERPRVRPSQAQESTWLC